jgi:hypothetical protein
MSFGFSEEPRVKGQNVISNAIAQTLAERDQRIDSSDKPLWDLPGSESTS